MKLPGTQIEVDDFRPEDVTHYVLTHYHADHRRGLEPGDRRQILCSSVTKRLLTGLLSIRDDRITTIDPGESLQWTDDIHVRAFDANHCPGALMLLFETEGRRLLHTGDFRYCAAHDAYPEMFESIDTLLLDCTYERDADDRFDHPPLEEAIERVLELIAEHPKMAVNVGVYMVGKNRLIQAISERFKTRVSLPVRYHRIYSLLGMDRFVTPHRRGTRIHGLPMGYLKNHFQKHQPRWYDDSIVILPTGWTAGFGEGKHWYYVPYSEHNSARELRAFVAKVGAGEVINTNEFFPGPVPVP